MKNKASEVLYILKDKTSTGIEYLTPVIAEKGEQIFSVCKTAENAVNDKLKKKSKQIKRYKFMLKVKKVLEFITSITLLAATVIAFIAAVKAYFNEK